MKSYYNIGLFILRVGFSALMLTHGIPKFLQLVQGDFSFGDPLGIGATISFFLTVFAEFVCSILVLIGYKTRLACIPLIVTMLVAVLVVHLNDPIGSKELGLVYLLAFTAIALMGPGKFGFDRR